MNLLKSCGYQLEARQLSVATLLLALVFLIVRAGLGDSLSIGYAMAVPVYVFLSAVMEHARLEKSSFRELRGWVETAIAAAGAVGTAYLGYRLWLLGY